MIARRKKSGGGQPDSDMKVDFAEIGIGKIGKIGISDFLNLKLPILANFGKIENKIFLEFPIFYSISATFIGVFVPILLLAKKVLKYFLYRSAGEITTPIQSFIPFQSLKFANL